MGVEAVAVPKFQNIQQSTVGMLTERCKNGPGH